MVNSTGIITGPKRDLVGYEGNPPKVAWPGGAKIAISLVVNYEEGSELAIGDGDATREPSGPAGWPITKRDLAGEGAFEYGSRAGYWRLLDVFDEQEVKCTFYACAVALERNRDAAKEMRGRGHDVMSHGYR
jgi:allantoinase